MLHRLLCFLFSSFFALNIAAQQLHIQFDSVEVYTGDTIGVDFIVSGFDSIFSMQMPIRWDGSVVSLVLDNQFNPPKPYFIPHPAIGSDFLFNYATFPDTLLIQWMAPFGSGGIQPKTLPSGDALITLFFKATGNAGMETALDTFSMAFGVEIMASINNQDVQIPLITSSGRIRIIEECPPNAPVTNDTLYICAGESFNIHNQLIEQAGNYNFTLENSVFCDSILFLTVIEIPLDTTLLTFYSCNPVDTGFQYQLLQNQSGCDSLIISYTSLNPTDILWIENLVCEGSALPQDTFYLTNQFGCDSLLIHYYTEVPADVLTITNYVCNASEAFIDTVFLQNDLGCDSIIINQFTYIPVSYQTTSLPANCAINNGSATILTDTSFIASVLWSNAATGLQNTGLSEGIYSFEITTVNGCSIVDSVEVGVQSGLLLDVSTSILPCEISGAWTIQGLPSGGTGSYNYMWNTGETTASISVEPSIYSLTVTDSEGCTAEIEFEPSITGSLILNATMVNPECYQSEDGSIEIQNLPPGTSFIWSGMSDTGQIVSNLGAGTYLVEAMDPFGCTGIDSFHLTHPDPVDLTASQINPICGSTPGVVSAFAENGQSPYSYQWSNGGAGSITGVSQEGWIIVTVTDAKGCSGTDSVFAEAFEGVQLSITQQDITCYGADNGSIDITPVGGTEPFVIQWSHGPQQEDLSNLPPGIYEVNVEDANGCLAAATINISQPDSMQVQINITEHSSGQGWNVTTSISGGVPPYQYQWSNGAVTPFLNNVPGAAYELTVADANSCETQLIIDLVPVSVFDYIQNTSILLFPNPAVDILNIKISQAPANLKAVKLFDLSGRLILSARLPEVREQQIQLELPPTLPNGFYAIEIEFGNQQSIVQKFEILR